MIERGCAVRLALLATRGVVAKVGRGRYRVVKDCAELLDVRLEGMG